MKTVSKYQALLLSFFLFVVDQPLLGQFTPQDLRDTTIQADYVFVTPPEYLSTIEPLAAFRVDHNEFSVAMALTDSIYSQFGQEIPADSAIREFATFALMNWQEPVPQYFLLVGNVNTLPSHKEPGFEFIDEDSIMVDQWFVEGVADTVSFIHPAAAVGRFPAIDISQLETMVTKTLPYETLINTPWVQRSIVVADYDPNIGSIYESIAFAWNDSLAHIWNDTVTVHVRETSPLHRTVEEFLDLVAEGAGWVSLLGYNEWYFFSKSMYFTTWDVDSLENYDLLPLWILESSQRFERTDTFAVGMNLMQLSRRGAVAVLSPTGHIFLLDFTSFALDFISEMVEYPTRSIGSNLLSVKRRRQGHSTRITTLLGDPALVIHNPTTTVPPAPPLPENFTLHQNYPNPFNPETSISIEIPRSSRVSLKVHDILGREIATVVNETLPAGTHTYKIDSRKLHLSTGVYFYRMHADGATYTRKMIVLQ